MGNLIGAFLLVAPAGANAKPPEAAAGTELTAYAPSTAPLTLQLIARRFAETDARINALKATFRQFVRLEGSDVVQAVEGDVAFRKPDLLRLTHRVPEPQTVVSDGTWLWVHRQGTNQVIQSRLEAWRKSETLAQGLLDFGKSADLLARYATELTTVSAPGADGHREFTLTLRPKAADRKGEGADFVLTLKADTRNFFPGDATLRVGRASIRSLFNDVRLNPAFPEGTFRFSPPPDADLFKSPEPK
ncbi:MAG: outer membrane lipoprotein carrier protein LolA [Elusimicrobia bacterium]|nr:outer membrane lipoprotein carrier protein LolA [Elusimicrobiota bacterium]